MLKERVLTAVVLVLALLALLVWASPAWVSVCFGGIVVLAGWEWAGLMRWKPLLRWAYGGLAGIFIFLLSTVAPVWHQAIWALATAFWLLAIPLWMIKGWRLLDRPLLGAVVGLLLLLSTWAAIVRLHQLGAGVMLAILASVWVADIAAYFTGRRFGRHKLAPAISPGKTREGAYGAVLGVIGYGLLLGPVVGLWTVDGPLRLLMVAGLLFLLTVLSIVGDLFESLLKRQAGIKDSSQLLPGHGGILDRIDSMTSTLPLIALALSLSS